MREEKQRLLNLMNIQTHVRFARLKVKCRKSTSNERRAKPEHGRDGDDEDKIVDLEMLD